jgi:hypothetical protein
MTLASGQKPQSDSHLLFTHLSADKCELRVGLSHTPGATPTIGSLIAQPTPGAANKQARLDKEGSMFLSR